MTHTTARIAAFIGLVACLVGCKPTEAGYQAAYDAARKKIEATEQDMMLPAQLQSVDGIQLQPVGGDSIWVSYDMLRAVSLDGDTMGYTPFGVGVALFRFDTNARSMAADLRKKGYDALTATDGKEKWWVVATTAATIDEGGKKLHEFMQKNSNFRYIGIPSAVLLRMQPAK